MDRLDPAQRETVSKMSTQRLIVKLTQIGNTEDDLADKQLSDLLSMHAQAIADGKDKTLRRSVVGTAAVSATTKTDTEIARLQLELETKRFEALQQQRAEEQQRWQAKEQAAGQRMIDEIAKREGKRRIREELEARDQQVRDQQLALEREKLELEKNCAYKRNKISKQKQSNDQN
jgi:hypothetical protein